MKCVKLSHPVCIPGVWISSLGQDILLLVLPFLFFLFFFSFFQWKEEKIVGTLKHNYIAPTHCGIGEKWKGDGKSALILQKDNFSNTTWKDNSMYWMYYNLSFRMLKADTTYSKKWGNPQLWRLLQWTQVKYWTLATKENINIIFLVLQGWLEK